MTAQYVYGVTHGDTVLPDPLRGIDGAAVTLVRHDRCGALVSDLAADRALGTRDDLVAHERVLEAMAQAGLPVLPFRFGAAMTGPAEVADDLLAAHQDRLTEDLGKVEDRLELIVKGRYDQSVYREVLDEEPEVREIRDRIRDLPEEATHGDRVRMGELVERSLARKRAADGEHLVAALSACAEDVFARPLAGEHEAVNTAFLVGRDRRGDFERALDALGREWAGRIGLRLIGPVPPYDFVGSRTEPATS